jgi:hypothetical protein
MFAGNGGFQAASGAGHAQNEIEFSKMHEVDPQSDSQSDLHSEDRTEARLTEALRRMAAASRQGARPEVGAGLISAFRRHHTRRRNIRRMRVGVVALVIVMVAAAISLRKPPTTSNTAQQIPAKATETGANAPSTNHKTVPVEKAETTPVKSAARRRPTRTRAVSAANGPFVALPAYDPQVPLDQLQVVRVQLPPSALWQMGAPISANYGTRRMTADIVLSQGGTPYAVRLVQ